MAQGYLKAHLSQASAPFLYSFILPTYLYKGQETQDSLLFTEQFIDLPHLAGHMASPGRGSVSLAATARLQSVPWEGGTRRSEHWPVQPWTTRAWADIQTQLHFTFLSSSVMSGVSVTRPVPMVRLPSRRVKRWPFSKIIGCRKIRLSFRSSPGMASSWRGQRQGLCMASGCLHSNCVLAT